jgi:hypothetical protein
MYISIFAPFFLNFRLTAEPNPAIWCGVNMSEDEYLKCRCKECGNNIEYPASSARDTIACPHCGEWTELEAPEDPDEPKAVVNVAALALWVALPLLLLAGIVFFVHHKTAVTATQAPPPAPVKVAVKPAPPPPSALTNVPPAPAAQQPPAKPRPKSLADLKVGEVKVEKAKEGNLTFAVGTVTNDSDYQHFGVRIELELISLQGSKIGNATDYISILEPHKEWHIHAIVTETKAVAARVVSLKEQQ